ncbi:MAG: hypothetical protein Q4E99_04450, partial [Bacillota bacterium]|nr:hypothetical protein [Bacillota bacterium]
IYTTEMLLEKNSQYSNAYNKIQRDCKNGKILKLMRGLYEDNPSVSPYLCSAYIYGPSYISFDYVLSQCGLIPEYVPNITCASFRKNKIKTYDTPIGSFIYRDIPEAAFPLGTHAEIENGYSYIIATPEKALCDKLYCVRQVHSLSAFEKLLFEDLRIDKYILNNLDWSLISSIAPKYNKSNLRLLLRYHSKEASK